MCMRSDVTVEQVQQILAATQPQHRDVFVLISLRVRQHGATAALVWAHHQVWPHP